MGKSTAAAAPASLPYPLLITSQKPQNPHIKISADAST